MENKKNENYSKSTEVVGLTETTRITEEFFKRRFPEKDIDFEKKCGHFYEWMTRFKSGEPEIFMDSGSLAVWKQMQEEGFK